MPVSLFDFCRQPAGNIAVGFALALAPMAAAVGGAIDFTRTVTIGSEIQTALDSGVLAAASLTQDRDPEEVVRAFVEAAIAEHAGVLESLEVTVRQNIALNVREVGADAVVSVPTLMLGIVGLQHLEMRRTAEALERVEDLEISLVLDVSGSMSGSKIDALRDAASAFVDTVLGVSRLDHTSVSVIPYNGGVRLPASMTSALVGEPSSGSGCLDLGTDLPTSVALLPGSLAFLQWNGHDQEGTRSSSHCPESDESAVFLRNDAASLQSLIADLEAGGNTGLDVATGWGARALDPGWRGRLGSGAFADRPADYDASETLKVLVIMTDGAATAQSRTYHDGNRWRSFTLYSAGTARSNMSAVCEATKNRGVVIYTIAFQLSGSTNRNLMRNCASAPSHYYEVESLDIASAFASIAADINRLRLSR